MPYQCQRCGACCRWPGQVKLDEGEITAIAAFQGMAESDFIERFTRLQVNRQGLALIDKPGGECIFYEANGCAIQPVKPRQCVDFPEKWNFPGFKSLCQAVWYAE